MKRLLTLVLALCGVFALSGCAIVEEDFREIMEEENNLFVEEEWDSFTFKSLTGKDDLTVYRDTDVVGTTAISTTNYDENFLAIVVHKTDCEGCKQQAPWLNELAKEFFPKGFDINFTVVFLDIPEDSATTKVDWLNDLTHVDAYTNVTTICSGGACQEVFLPSFDTPIEGTIYFVDKKNIYRTRKGLTWDVTADSEQQYQTLRKQVASFLGLKPIGFNPSVDDWEETNSGSTNL